MNVGGRRRVTFVVLHREVLSPDIQTSLPRYTEFEIQTLISPKLSNGCSIHDAILELQKEQCVPTVDLVNPVAVVCAMDIRTARLAVVRATNSNDERSIYRTM